MAGWKNNIQPTIQCQGLLENIPIMANFFGWIFFLLDDNNNQKKDEGKQLP